MLSEPEIIIGVHSPLEAKLIDHLGGDAIWISGYSISAACFGLPDLDLPPLDEKLQIIKRIVRSSRSRVFVDIDSGMENEDTFAEYLDRLSELNIDALCIEDEALPKTSALYEQTKPLIKPSDFVDRLHHVCRHTNAKVIARTNAIVRDHEPSEIFDRIGVICELDCVSAIALHGSNVDRIRDVVSKFPTTDFYLITTLLEDGDFSHLEDLRLKGLIFGHDMLFSSVR